MNWIQKQKLLAIEAIHFNGRPYIKSDDLWQALYLSFNSAHNCHININILDKISSKPIYKWKPFSKEEFKDAISKCNNSSASGPDKILWKILKQIINDNMYLSSIINIANTYINLGYWSSHFKTLTSIIILIIWLI